MTSEIHEFYRQRDEPSRAARIERAHERALREREALVLAVGVRSVMQRMNRCECGGILVDVPREQWASVPRPITTRCQQCRKGYTHPAIL